MLTFSNYFSRGLQSTLRLQKGTNLSYKGQWIQVFTNTEIDRWYVGDFASASYQITVEFNSNKKEVINAVVVARPDQARVLIFGRVSIDDELISLTATVNDSYVSIKATVKTSAYNGTKIIFLATYAETINELTSSAPVSYLLPQEDTPGSGGGSGGGGGGGGGTTTTYLDDLLDVVLTSPDSDQYLKFNGTNWVNSPLDLTLYAPIDNPTFTGTVTGITPFMVGLGNVTNQSKETMFNNPTFTGTVNGITASMIGLGNVTNQSKTTMFTDSTLTGNTSIQTAYITGLSVGGNTPVTLISTDPTLASASSTTIPTQSAVKSYVDNAISVIEFNLSNPTLTGTTNIAAVNVSGLATFQELAETVNNKTLATGVVVHDTTTGVIWYHSSISSNFTANFTNLPTTNGRTTTLTLVLDQGASAYIPTAVQIDGVAQTINWQSGTVPTGNASKKDIVSFTLIRNSSTWIVLGSLGTFG